MRSGIVLVIAIALLALAAVGIVRMKNPRMTAPASTTPPIADTTLRLTSAAFTEGATIPAPYTCDGANMSPPLEVSDVPEGTVSLALIMDDPDAPRGTWDHWVVFNIPPDTKTIEEGKEPPGVHGRGSGAALMYSGPCPPDREHRYFFKLYALDAMLILPEGASKEDVAQAMQGYILAHAQLMGRYDRQKD